MNLFTSISKNIWLRFLCSYIVSTIIIGGILAVAIIILDPYDTGRLTFLASHGIPHNGQRMAVASLARQPQFDSALIGNSTIQLINPTQIDNAHAVSLAMPGTGPLEQMTVTKWFLRHHDKPHAIIIGIDDRWCEANSEPRLTHAFPFWLYGDSDWDYVINMLRYKTIEAAIKKIRLLVGALRPMRADGYNDYDAGRNWNREDFKKRLSEPNEEASPPASNPPYAFPAATMLRDVIKSMPVETQIILVMPPQYKPDFTGNAGLQQHACEKTYKALAKEFAQLQLLNFISRQNLTSNDSDYWDRQHYRAHVARILEDKIGQELHPYSQQISGKNTQISH